MKTIFTFCFFISALVVNAQIKPSLISLKSSEVLGDYLADKNGRTLYYFVNDANGKSNCTGGCVLTWPVFNEDKLTADQLGTGLDMTDFSTITNHDDIKQITYKGWPLYYFSPKKNGVNIAEEANMTTGDGVGGVWYVAKPNYSVMLASAQLTGHDGINYKSDYTAGEGKTVYLTDEKGRTLYTFKNDKANKNTFTKSDFSNNNVWPIYEADKIVVPSGLDKTMFGSINFNGKKQLTYKGWPLYYFGKDEGTPGSNKGISFPKHGIWPVAVKDLAAAVE